MTKKEIPLAYADLAGKRGRIVPDGTAVQTDCDGSLMQDMTGIRKVRETMKPTLYSLMKLFGLPELWFSFFTQFIVCCAVYDMGIKK